MEKHDLSKIDFELIDDAFKALLQSRPDPAVADKVAVLRDKFRDAFSNRPRKMMLMTVVGLVAKPC